MLRYLAWNILSWCVAPFEPEGILSSISAIISTIIGVHFGHILTHIKDHTTRLWHWTVMGFSLLILGLVLHFTRVIPLNIQLYSFSYVCVTAGAASLVFSIFYVVVDIWKWKYVFMPLEWIWMNAMLVYVLAAANIFVGFINGWYYADPHNTLVYWIQKHIFIDVWQSCPYLYGFAYDLEKFFDEAAANFVMLQLKKMFPGAKKCCSIRVNLLFYVASEESISYFKIFVYILEDKNVLKGKEMS